MKTILRSFGHFALIFSLSLLTVACGSSRSTTTVAKGGGGKTPYKPIEYVKIDAAMAPQSQAVLTEAKKWLGTPYKYGGEDKNGIDCSALVLNVFRDALDIKIPRTSRQQFDFTDEIGKNDLIPGDLLFFATSRGRSEVSHVGLYIGDGKMVHSSASRGVMVSRINDDYFTRTFAGAGRVGSYYAMIGSTGNKKKGKNKDKDENPLPETSPEKHPFILEPVAEIPVKKNPEVAPSPEPVVAVAPAAPVAPVASSEPAAPSVNVAVASSSQTSPEISAEQARAQVLNSLIEQKLDSIYSSVEP